MRRFAHLIRRTFLVVLTLATMGALVVTLTSERDRFHVWQIDEGRSIWIRLSSRNFGAIYSTVDDPLKPDIRSSWMGFGFGRVRMYSQPEKVYSNTMHAIFCPPWVIVGPLGIYPALVFFRGPFRRWRRRRRGGCLKCGYDLTGNVSSVCPECGTSIGSEVAGIRPPPTNADP